MDTIMLVKTNLVIDQYNALHIIQTSIALYYLKKKINNSTWNTNTFLRYIYRGQVTASPLNHLILKCNTYNIPYTLH